MNTANRLANSVSPGSILRRLDDDQWGLMNSQSAIFVEMDQRLREVEPRGFRYQDELLSEQEEVVLAANLVQLDLEPFEFHGYLGNRRVVNFGFKYDFTHRSVQKADDIPPFLNDLLSRAASFAGCEKEVFRQVGVSESSAGARHYAVSESARQILEKSVAYLETPVYLYPLRGGSS